MGTGGAAGPIGPGATIAVQVAGVGSIPADAMGAVLNITATEGTAPSFVSAWPTGSAKPDASILNINPGQNLPSMITMALGADGRIDSYNYAGSVQLVADVAGYLVPVGAGGQGPVGPPGPPGPSAVQYETGQQVLLDGPRQIYMDIAYLHDLPAGSHLVQADLVAVLFSGEALVRCRISASGQTSTESSAWVGGQAGTANLGAIAVKLPVSTAAPFDAVLQCKDDGLTGDNAYVESIQLHAIQVGSIRTNPSL